MLLPTRLLSWLAAALLFFHLFSLIHSQPNHKQNFHKVHKFHPPPTYGQWAHMGVGIRVSSNQWCSSHFTKDCVDKKYAYPTANCWKDTKKLFCIKRNFRKSLKKKLCFGEMPVHLFLQCIAHFPNLSTQLGAEWKFSKWHFDPLSTIQPAGDKAIKL